MEYFTTLPEELRVDLWESLTPLELLTIAQTNTSYFNDPYLREVLLSKLSNLYLDEWYEILSNGRAPDLILELYPDYDWKVDEVARLLQNPFGPTRKVLAQYPKILAMIGEVLSEDQKAIYKKYGHLIHDVLIKEIYQGLQESFNEETILSYLDSIPYLTKQEGKELLKQLAKIPDSFWLMIRAKEKSALSMSEVATILGDDIFSIPWDKIDDQDLADFFKNVKSSWLEKIITFVSYYPNQQERIFNILKDWTPIPLVLLLEKILGYKSFHLNFLREEDLQLPEVRKYVKAHWKDTLLNPVSFQGLFVNPPEWFLEKPEYEMFEKRYRLINKN